MKDFDALFKEKEVKGAEFKLYGKKYTLPQSLPAKTALYLAKCESEAKIEGVLLEVISNDLFGKDNVADWLERGMGIKQLQDLIEWAMGETTGTAKNE